MFSRWTNRINRVVGFAPLHRRVRRQTTPQRTRPAVEALEDRCLLSSYTVTDLGTLGGSSSSAAGINNAGKVVGSSYTNKYQIYWDVTGSKPTKEKIYQEQPFLWAPSAPNGTKGSLFDIGNQADWKDVGTGINSSGQVVGISNANGLDGLAFLWSPSTPNGTSGTLNDLGTLGGIYSDAFAINTAGQVVGQSTTSSGDFHAFLWTPSTPNGATGSLLDLGALPGASSSFARGINDAGEVVGGSGYSAFLYSGGKMIDLGSLGGSSAYAEGINSYGQVVGVSDVNNYSHAFLWTPTTPHGTTGTLTDLGTLGGGGGFAYGINSAGQVVGEASTSSGPSHAFLWTPTTPNGTTGTMTDLNTLAGSNTFTLYSATGINDQGQIVGDGSTKGAFLLTPTNLTAAQVQTVSSASATGTTSPAIANSGGTSLISPALGGSSIDPAALSVALSVSQLPAMQTTLLLPSFISNLPPAGSSQPDSTAEAASDRLFADLDAEQSFALLVDDLALIGGRSDDLTSENSRG
jgi:probable HAF family extracellular repeat protein